MVIGVERKGSYSNERTDSIQNFLQEASSRDWTNKGAFWCPKWGLLRGRRNISRVATKMVRVSWITYEKYYLKPVEGRVKYCSIGLVGSSFSMRRPATLGSWLQLECITAKILHFIDRGSSWKNTDLRMSKDLLSFSDLISPRRSTSRQAYSQETLCEVSLILTAPFLEKTTFWTAFDSLGDIHKITF